MGWKDWSYWLKGGIIGICIGIIIDLLYFFFMYSFPEWFDGFIIFVTFDFGFIISPLVCKGSLACILIDVLITLILFVFEVAILGALIGWIYGKIIGKK
ncbi:hypothetical protein COU54_04765 [Candidatus Pacearchaeota archaeon CG10_big_fil_rev_8_21_14_0_10_31_24]|nr:MAG: hypothetical protein COU54_04765 [Candidatus Pacearchaeota archaeon CG10_big_fil_rev_8_21_14_0_10_31_24]